MDFIKVLLILLGFTALIFILAAIFALPVMLLWNWVGVGVLGLKAIGWLEAWGLLCLSGLLFKNSSAGKSDS